MNHKDLEDIPEIPEEILDAVDQNKLLIFIGAGVSKLCGYPLWDEMAHNLVDVCFEKGVITRSDQSILKDSDFTSMQLVTIAYKMLKKKRKERVASESIINELSEKKVKEDTETAEKIAAYLSNYQSKIITTNADLSLDKTKSFEHIYIVDNLYDWNKDDTFNTFIHIHGSINNFDKMVFTSEQYANTYMAYGDNGISEKLRVLLNPDHTILFLGYGANEFELIKYFLKAKKSGIRNLFLLKGYLKKDSVRKAFDLEYYESLGIILLPYSMEENGYFTLIDVLEKWNGDITTKTTAHLHVDKYMENVLKKKPDQLSSKYIKCIINDKKNEKQAVRLLVKSEFMNDWIIELKEESIFSVANIKPGIIHGDNGISSNYWEALPLVSAYSERKMYSREIDSFVIKLLNDSIAKYANDTEENPQKRLDSSFTILAQLSDIIFSRSKYINECDSEKFTEVFLKSRYAFVYTIIEDICKRYHNEANRNKIFKILINIVDSKECDEGAKLLTNEVVRQYIKDSPFSYYEYSKNKLLETQNEFYTMGSFYDYPEDPIYRQLQDVIAVNWFRYASESISDDVLTEDINKLMNSNKVHLKKASLALLNINFERLRALFVNNLDRYISDKDFYSDLCCLIDNNYNKLEEKEKELIVKSINNANWGRNTEKLINHLRNVIRKYDNKITSKQETKRDLDIVKNINRKVYSVDNPMEEEIQQIENDIQGMDFNQLLEYYNKHCSGSFFYQEALDRTFINYLIKKGIQFIKDNLKKIDSKLLMALLDYYNEDIIMFETISKELCNRQCYEAYRVILYACEKQLNKEKNEEVFEIIKQIDFHRFDMKEEYRTDSVITEIINETLFTYLETYSIVAMKVEEAKPVFKQTVDDCKTIYPGSKLKAILAGILPYINKIDCLYVKDLFAYVFDNKENATYPSYLMYSISHDKKSSDIFNHIFTRNDFKIFLSTYFSDFDSKHAQSTYGFRITECYFQEKLDIQEYFELIARSKNFESITNGVELINVWLRKGTVNLDKVSKYLMCLSKIIDTDWNNDNFDSDILIRDLSELQILVDDEVEITWEIINKLFDNFDNNFTEATYKLFNKYIDKEIDNIDKIMTKYVKTYKEHITNAEMLKKTLKLFKDDDNHRDSYRIWKNIITQENRNFFDDIT